MSDELGRPGEVTPLIRLKAQRQLDRQKLGVEDAAGYVPPDYLPSLSWRMYQRGDHVAINEVVLRNQETGDMVVVYPGSREAAARAWPTWQQVTSPL